MLPEKMLASTERQAGAEPKRREKFSTLEELEARYIERVVSQFGNTTEGKKKAAKTLGIGIATLYRKLGAIYQNDKQ